MSLLTKIFKIKEDESVDYLKETKIFKIGNSNAIILTKPLDIIGVDEKTVMVKLDEGKITIKRVE